MSGSLIGFLNSQRGHLFPWVPVFLGIGIGLYFCLSVEPDRPAFMAIGALAVFCFAVSVFLPNLRPLLLAVGLVASGLCLAGYRSHSVAEPVLNWRYYGPVQGRIVAIDRSVSDKVRLTLDQVVMREISPQRTPARVRVSLHGDFTGVEPVPGLTVMLTANMSPPQGPVEPGGFDFQRMAWFQQLGAVGYSRAPVVALYPASEGQQGLMVYRLRKEIARAVQAVIPGDAGAFASAIMNGDRSDISPKALADLRASNLAHLLAISGLHMGLLTAFVFGAIRSGLSFIAPLALRLNVKKVAAVGALGAASFYLALSGGNIATERAFIQVAVMLVAILFNRRALTLRSVALAAIIVMCLRPEAITGPGFQMSFAATTALVAVFGAMTGFDHKYVPKVLQGAFGVLMSSLVAGLATAPVAAVHFNQIAHYGLAANLSTVPLMGAVVIPAAVAAALLIPFGLSWIPLKIMEWAVTWILFVADWIASRDGALSHVATPSYIVLPILCLGMLWLVLVQGRVRFAGLAPALVAFGLWAATDRPDLLISQSGGLVGLLGPDGRALSKPKGEGFVARNWLENDGEVVAQEDAAQRSGFEGQGAGQRFQLGSETFVHVTGKAVDDGAQSCREGWVIANKPVDSVIVCNVIDPRLLRETGTLAVYQTRNGLRFVSSTDVAGRRPWNTRQRSDRS